MSTVHIETSDNRPHVGKSVTVVFRTAGGDDASRIAESIASQSYEDIQLVVVELVPGCGSRIPLPPGRRAEVVTTAVSRTLADAANAGLAAATGDIICIADDSGWLYPNHVATLVAALEHSEALVAYGDVDLVECSADAAERTVGRLGGAFDPLRLRYANYIALHATAFSRAALAVGARFDDTPRLATDWDFVLQLAQHVRFSHVCQSVGATRVQSKESPADRARLEHGVDQLMLHKWLASLDSASLAKLARRADDLGQERERLLHRIGALAGELAATRRDAAAAQREAASVSLQQCNTINELTAAVSDLGALNRRITHSTVWKLRQRLLPIDSPLQQRVSQRLRRFRRS